MKKILRDRRGVAAFEFCLIAVPLFTTMFVIFDLARYTLTQQSLKALADAGARTAMLCSTNSPTNVAAVQRGTWPSACTGTSLMTSTAMHNAAPFLFLSSYTVTLDAVASASTVTVTASSTFAMLMPIFGTALNAPSASSTIPF